MTRSVLAFPKPSRKEDSDYLRYVRRQGCLLHNQVGAEAHHVVTRGAGGSDYETVPLCWPHHQEYHRKGRAAFEEAHNVNLEREMKLLLIRYLSALKDGEDLGK